MKPGLATLPAAEAAAIVHLASVQSGPVDATHADALKKARDFAAPLLEGQLLDTGEDALAHAEGTAAVLASVGAAPDLCAAAYLVYAGDYLQRPEDVVKKLFGEHNAVLVTLTRKLVQIQRAARKAPAGAAGADTAAMQAERVRKMLLAFSRDLRVVLLRLASRLQTLRFFAAMKQPCPVDLATESLQIFAPLANRLGIWQVKWELEDLSFRFLRPDEYQRMAALVDQTRSEREASVQAAKARLAGWLAEAGITADVKGRPKHLYSIWKKMQGKGVAFDRVLDARALRVIVPDVAAAYAALARVHAGWTPVDGEFDDYIARPKANGYQSLHTVVFADDGRPLEVQVRTQAMHEHAEHGVAAHWMYKEAGTRGYAGVAATGASSERIAEARKAVLRELLAWERDSTAAPSASAAAQGDGVDDERIYVFTPQATIIDLPVGGTPVDFAYSLHSEVGHRCRGAKVDGAMVPLNTPLASGQTVEVVTVREGGPSLDWLNAELGYLKSPRARAKVRAWFNLQAQGETIARGREAVEKLLQREGRTALKLDALAEQLGFDRADALFEVVGKDEYSLKNIENLLRPAAPPAPDDAPLLHRPRAGGAGRGGVLVVGVDSLLTTLARCCRPAPPDVIGGFVTRGRGVAIHRRDCSNYVHMAQATPGRVIEVEWGVPRNEATAAYPLDVVVEAADRPGLLRDISEVFAKERMNVTDVDSHSGGRAGPDWRTRRTRRAADGGTALMTFTVEASDTARLATVLAQIARVAGVRHARRK